MIARRDCLPVEEVTRQIRLSSTPLPPSGIGMVCHLKIMSDSFAIQSMTKQLSNVT